MGLNKDSERKREQRCERRLVVVLPEAHTLNQKTFLNAFDIVQNGPFHEQSWAKSNITKFHKSVQYYIYKCTVCHEVWPVKTKPRSLEIHVCSRCTRGKKSPKKFSIENSMVPSPVPTELQDMTQAEEMLIAQALPIMAIYIKPGGQRVTQVIVSTYHKM